MRRRAPRGSPPAQYPTGETHMTTRVAINGFGRIGRQVFKIADRFEEIEIVAINDIADIENMAYLLKYDTVYGKDERDIRADEGYLVIGERHVPVFSISDPTQLPWRELEVDI